MQEVEFISIIWLLPIVFMIHDFEEVIFFKWWIDKNREVLSKKYPFIIRQVGGTSTAGFVVGVAEEFIILILITISAVIFNWYYLWFSALIGFFVHLVIHVIQWIVFKKYVPVIVTSFPAMIYSVYAIYFVYNKVEFETLPLILWCIFGIIIVFVNIVFAHKLARRFDKFVCKSLNNENVER